VVRSVEGDEGAGIDEGAFVGEQAVPRSKRKRTAG